LSEPGFAGPPTGGEAQQHADHTGSTQSRIVTPATSRRPRSGVSAHLAFEQVQLLADGHDEIDLVARRQLHGQLPNLQFDSHAGRWSF
jgi:hypothetical protein